MRRNRKRERGDTGDRLEFRVGRQRAALPSAPFAPLNSPRHDLRSRTLSPLLHPPRYSPLLRSFTPSLSLSPKRALDTNTYTHTHTHERSFARLTPKFACSSLSREGGSVRVCLARGRTERSRSRMRSKVGEWIIAGHTRQRKWTGKCGSPTWRIDSYSLTWRNSPLLPYLSQARFSTSHVTVTVNFGSQSTQCLSLSLSLSNVFNRKIAKTRRAIADFSSTMTGIFRSSRLYANNACACIFIRRRSLFRELLDKTVTA